MEVGIIAAIAKGGVIGNGGDLPWKIKKDMDHFRALTTGHPVIMGRRTYESLEKGPLKDRLNIVLSKNMDPTGGIIVRNSLEDALNDLKGCEKKSRTYSDVDFSKAYIIGGSKVYREAIDKVDFMDLTRIWNKYDGDVHFPDFNERDWKDVSYENHKDLSFVSYKNRIKQDG